MKATSHMPPHRTLVLGKLALALALSAGAGAAQAAASASWEVSWANHCTTADVSSTNAVDWHLTLPVEGGPLPSNSVVRLTKITIAARGDETEIPTSLTVYEDESTPITSATYDAGVYASSMIGNNTVRLKKLSYAFDDGPLLTVGTRYLVRPQGKTGAGQIAMKDQALVMPATPNHSLIYAIEADVVEVSERGGKSAILDEGDEVTAITWETDEGGDPAWGCVEVSGDTTLNLAAATEGFSRLTLNVNDGAALTIVGAAVTATTVEVTGGGVVILPTGAGIAGKLVGDGTVDYPNGLPSGLVLGDGWRGNIRLSDTTTSTTHFENIQPGLYCNPLSTLTFSGISGYAPKQTNYCHGCLNLEDNGDVKAFRIEDGYSNFEMVFARLTGSGSIFAKDHVRQPNHLYRFLDASGWTGSILRGPTSLTERFAFGSGAASTTRGTTTIAEDVAVTMGDGAVFENGNGLVVNGVLDVTGSTAKSPSKIAGSGRVICDGKMPTFGDYTSTNWTGTLVLKNLPKQWPLNLFNSLKDNSLKACNTNSAVELVGAGANGECLVEGLFASRLVLTDDGSTPGLSLNDGYSNRNTVIGELSGGGTLRQTNNNISQGLTINVMTNFTGHLELDRMTVTFGTARRTGRDEGHWQHDDEAKAFIDTNAVLSVNAPFTLWNPVELVFDGPVNFNVEGDLVDRQVLFANPGQKVTFGDHASFTINGQALDPAKYRMGLKNGNIVLKFRGRSGFFIIHR